MTLGQWSLVLLIIDFTSAASATRQEVERMEFTCVTDSGGFNLTENILEYLEKKIVLAGLARVSYLTVTDFARFLG
jgi:hypothetical protein